MRLLLAALLACGFVTSASAGAETNWIWATVDAAQEAPVGTCHFRKVFQVDKPHRGLIEITCDNRYVLRLNGRLVGASNTWQQLDRYDVTALLQPGENELQVRCVNDEGAAGLAVTVVIERAGQPELNLSTDATWHAFLQPKGNWNPFARHDIKWQPAAVLGTFGKTGPWGKPAATNDIRIVAARGSRSADVPFELHDGDRVVLLGNTFIEREQLYGHWEAALTAQWPGRRVRFRNLGRSGDTVYGEARAGFDNAEQGFARLAEHVHSVKPTVILVGYGSNAAYAGEAGLDHFVAGYLRLLESLEQTGARLVLLSPLRCENLGAPLPDMTEQNKNIARYAEAIAAIAADRSHRFADLTQLVSPRPASEPLTNNGVHLTDSGYRRTARAFVQALGIEQPATLPAQQMNKLRSLIVKKNELYFHRWRPQNITYLYLFRKHEQGNNAREIPMFDPLVAETEEAIFDLIGADAAAEEN